MRIIPPAEWGRDHWSTLAYAFSCLGTGGALNIARMRSDGETYPTRLYGETGGRGSEVGHTDLDCLTDMEAAGVLCNVGTGANPVVQFTPEGLKLGQWLNTEVTARRVRTAELRWDVALKASGADLGWKEVTGPEREAWTDALVGIIKSKLAEPNPPSLARLAREYSVDPTTIRRIRDGKPGVSDAVQLPPIGARWGDLTPEQRASLPAGTELTFKQGPRIVKVRAGNWRRKTKPRGILWSEAEFSDDRVIAAYPAPKA